MVVKARNCIFLYTTVGTIARNCVFFLTNKKVNNLINLIACVIDSLSNVMVMKVYSP